VASRILLVSDATDDVVASALETPSHVVTRVADPSAAIAAEGEHGHRRRSVATTAMSSMPAASPRGAGLATVPILA
jgi:hypothetical protein